VGNIPESLRGKEQSVAELREAELRCASYHLGLSGLHFLDYRDSGMPDTADNHHPRALAAASSEQVAEEVTHYIRRIKPQVVLTFDPAGGYGHPDHIAMHQATVEAFHAAGDPSQYPNDHPPYQPQKLYFTTFSRRLLRFLVRLLPLLGRDPTRWGRNSDINLVEIAERHYPIHARIDVRSVSKVVERATACHASQLDGGPRQRSLVGWVFRIMSRKETFMRAYPPATDQTEEEDLFAGVRLDERSEESEV
jgi:LmbE family N-acetylglucosaminyl deacetylase